MHIIKIHMLIFTFPEFTRAKEMHLKHTGLTYMYLYLINMKVIFATTIVDGEEDIAFFCVRDYAPAYVP